MRYLGRRHQRMGLGQELVLYSPWLPVIKIFLTRCSQCLQSMACFLPTIMSEIEPRQHWLFQNVMETWRMGGV